MDWVGVAWIALFVGLLVTIGARAGGAAARERARLAARLVAVERTVDAIAVHLGVVVPEPRCPEVERLVAEGRQVAAIKAYREATGADLVTAKNAVDALAGRR